MQALTDESELEAQLEKLKEGISSLESMIMMSRAPNLKALEKIREVKDSYREVMDGTRHIHSPFMVGTTTGIPPLLNFLLFKFQCKVLFSPFK